MRPDLRRSDASHNEDDINSWQLQDRSTLRTVGVRSQLLPAHEQKRLLLPD